MGGEAPRLKRVRVGDGRLIHDGLTGVGSVVLGRLGRMRAVEYGSTTGRGWKIRLGSFKNRLSGYNCKIKIGKTL